MSTTTEQPIVRVSLIDTAKLIRAELRREFPHTKFSVRSSSYAGGCSIDIKWQDGPTEPEVNAITGGFAGARFNGMVDMKELNEPVEVNGQLTRYGVDYVQTHRRISPEWQSEIEAEIEQVLGEPLDFGKRYDATIWTGEDRDERARPIVCLNAGVWGSDLYHRLVHARRNDHVSDKLDAATGEGRR
jgi:hypothetical protein